MPFDKTQDVIEDCAKQYQWGQAPIETLKLGANLSEIGKDYKDEIYDKAK
jgi:hypothetical protein